jgi:hypothetical protein
MGRKRIAVITLVLAGSTLAGCGSFQPVTSGTNDSCATLNRIVSDYSSGFADLRGSGSNFSSVAIYRAKEELIRGHCEIWAWGNGETAYTCTTGAPDKAVAESVYTRASDQLSQCLGTEWNSEQSMRERNGIPAGERIRFSRNDGSTPAISLNRVEDRSRHSVYLYVGSVSQASEGGDNSSL